MRASEFVNEDRTPLRKALVQAAPHLTTYDDLDNNNHPYLAYRFGVALASAPDNKGYSEGPIGSRFTMVDYSDADTEIRKAAEKKMGIKSSSDTGVGSKELHSINTQSPMLPKGPVKPQRK
jgi:hypothetical protein